MDNITEYIGAAVGLLGLVLAAFKIIAKITKTKKDDEIAEKVDEVAGPILDSVGSKFKQPK